VPQNSFTGSVSFPKLENCSVEGIKERVLSQGRKETRASYPWLCQRSKDDYSSRLTRIFCIHEVSLDSLKIRYKMNVGWTKMAETEMKEVTTVESLHLSDFFNWGNNSNNELGWKMVQEKMR
jgi:hypothetical protein